MSKNTQMDRNTLIRSFAVQPLIDEKYIDTVSTGPLLLDSASIMNKKQKKALNIIVFVVATIMDMKDLVEETKNMNKKRKIKTKPYFDNDHLLNIRSLFRKNKESKDMQTMYILLIEPLLEVFGIYGIAEEE